MPSCLAVHDDADVRRAVRMCQREPRGALSELHEVQHFASRHPHPRKVEKLREQAAEPVRLAHHQMRERLLVRTGE